MARRGKTAKSRSWDALFEAYNIGQHDFEAEPFPLTGDQIKDVSRHFETTSQREVRTLVKQDTRRSRPDVFKEMGLFLLPVKNGEYAIIKGEGYVDIPRIESPLLEYESSFPFELKSTYVGNSEMQHLDRAYALSLIRHFVGDNTLVATIRGKKYTPEFSFYANGFQITQKGVQTEVDIGYEGESQIVLVEAKGGRATNTIIRQLYYPFRQWMIETGKKVSTLFFQRMKNGEFHIWDFGFDDIDDYNSIRLLRSARYKIINNIPLLRNPLVDG